MMGEREAQASPTERRGQTLGYGSFAPFSYSQAYHRIWRLDYRLGSWPEVAGGCEPCPAR
jgi:hypothetical protein